jgi:hypothetical protein
MAIDLKDQPRDSFFNYDITDSGYDMKQPYRVSKPVGAAAYVMVVLCALIVITWLSSVIAQAIS